MFFSRKKKKSSNPFSSTHNMRIKRGKKRYYAKSSLRRKIKRGMKAKGYPKRIRKHATKSGWA